MSYLALRLLREKDVLFPDDALVETVDNFLVGELLNTLFEDGGHDNISELQTLASGDEKVVAEFLERHADTVAAGLQKAQEKLIALSV